MRPLLATIFEGLKARGWALPDDGTFVDPDGKAYATLDGALAAQSFREIFDVLAEDPDRIDPRSVHERMLVLEAEHGEDETAGGALAKMLGISETELLDAMGPQLQRTMILCRDHYTPRVAIMPNALHMQTAMMQGITFAIAVLEQNGRLR